MGHVATLRLCLVAVLCLVSTLVLGASDGSSEESGYLSEPSETMPAASPASAGAAEIFSGWLHVIYADAPPGGIAGNTSEIVLIDDHGRATRLLLPEDVLRAAGGHRALNGRHVAVIGRRILSPLGAGQAMAAPLLAVQSIQLTSPETLNAIQAPSAVSGPQPFVTILCRFADEAGITPEPESYFEALLLGSASAPTLGHYWNELSYGNVSLTGSAVFGWYTLPQPRSYYVYGNPVAFDPQRAATDCTGVAAANVYFPSFVGINLAFNDDLGCCAYGGSWTISLNGQMRTYRITWLPPWGYENQAIIAHEMGHGFGLPHSSGPYSQTYDSAWDVMSSDWLDCPPYDPNYGCVGTHTISYHKDILGWIPAAQKYVATPGTSRTITLERLAQPTNGNYLMAQIPIGGSTTNFYTVEVRRFVGYDATLPGEAVIMHNVDTTRSDREAQVVDPDGNGDPNDAGAMWLPGETFFDSPNGISVAVVGQTATGFQVTVTNGVSAPSFTLSVTVSGTGTVTSTPAGISCPSNCSASFPSGTSVTLIPSGGTLNAWGGACSGSAGCTVGMTANQSVTATFATQTFPLTVSPVPTNGAVTGTGISCGTGTIGVCAESVASGTSLVLTASPATGYRVGTWSGCQSVSGAQCTVQMTQARTVSVTFTRTYYTLTVSPVPTHGSINGSGIRCGTGTVGVCTQSIASGTSLVLTASPATGYRVGAWSGCQSVSGAQCTVQMTQARTVSATFVLPPYGALYQSVPFTVGAGATITVPVIVTNTGSLTWGTLGYRLGYRWYQASMQLSKNKSNTLPATVGPRASVTVQARVVAPSSPGTYTIRWDMVRLGYLGMPDIWFSSQGVATGNFVVTVK